MKNFAVINSENKVINVIVADSKEIAEELTGLFCYEYTEQFPAGIGGDYDPILKKVIGKSPYPSWILNKETCKWETPIPYPIDENHYIWNESTVSWDLIE